MLAGKLLRLSGGIAVLGIIFATSLAAQPAAAAALTWTGSAGAGVEHLQHELVHRGRRYAVGLDQRPILRG